LSTTDNQPVTMGKRKRDDDVEEVFGRLRNELHHALKAAKGFERQRLSKRIRDPKAPREKKRRIENEILILKVRNALVWGD